MNRPHWVGHKWKSNFSKLINDINILSAIDVPIGHAAHFGQLIKLTRIRLMCSVLAAQWTGNADA